MTVNKRIALNVIATYGRSLFSIACGLFTGRWVLMSLGEIDYGLVGVIGGLTAFISFFNTLLGWALSRFYGVAVGQCKADVENGLKECQGWFNTAVMIHTIIPILGIVMGYPLGVWMIENYLTIPPEKIRTCIWVWRCVSFSCFVGMVNVPFQAMYVAKQYIAELTVYSFASTAANVIFVYYMVTHAGDWLLGYSIWMCLLSAVPQLLICVRALQVFPECTFDRHLMWSTQRLKEMAYYAGWQIFSTLGIMLQGQGLQIVYNKFFGASVNAAATVSVSVNGHANALSSSMQGAFSPAIMNACGARDDSEMRSLALRSCKLGSFFMLIFVVPLSVEIDTILEVWLKNPPSYASGLCLCVFASTLIEKLAAGHHVAICAKGKVALYQFVAGMFSLLTIPIALSLLFVKCSPYCVGASLAISSAVYMVIRLYFAQSLAGMSVKMWLAKVLVPIALIIFVASIMGMSCKSHMPSGIIRVFVVTIASEIGAFSTAAFFLFDKEEREVLVAKFRKVISVVDRHTESKL